LATCSRASTGGCRNRHGDHKPPADRSDLNRSHDRQSRQRRRVVIHLRSMSADDSLPDDLNTLKAMLRAERAARLAAEAEAQARTLLIEKLKLTIKKLRHEQFGQSSERGALLDQLELQLADLEENAAHAETEAQLAAAQMIKVPAFARSRPARPADPCTAVRAARAGTPAAAGAFTARAHRLSGAFDLPMLW